MIISLPATPVTTSTTNKRSKDKVILFENNYKYRNVYKSIIRRMTANIQENKEQLASFLAGKGFIKEDIELGFETVIACKDDERKSGNKKMGPRLINQAAKELSVYSYILKEAIDKMLNEWNNDKTGKVAKKNIETYKKVCKAYNDKLKKLFSK